MGNGTKTVAHGFPNRCPSLFGRLPMVLPNIAHSFTRLCPDDPYQDVARNVSTGQTIHLLSNKICTSLWFIDGLIGDDAQKHPLDDPY